MTPPHSNPSRDQPERSDDAAQQIVAFMSGWSLEATLPSQTEIEALKRVLAPRAQVYLSAIPGKPWMRLIEAATAVRKAGLEPVPHLAARNYTHHDELADFLARARGEADVRQLMLIAGDRDRPLGPFESSLSVIESGLLARHGIERIGISGYPEGHPKIADEALRDALTAKIEAARRERLDVHIVTQFSFDPTRILSWIEEVRGAGIDLPIWIGTAGPASVGALLKYAARCGISASMRGIVRQGSGLSRLLDEAAPDAVVRKIAGAPARMRAAGMAPHFYSFGGVEKTARWAAAAAAGRFEIGQKGFAVRP
jgi:methylenetetrahydrofolate reductase (NADPH)